MGKAVARPKVLRCAIYTRKSSEEGLEQDFNSLHAQRESCDAYIKSQKHEGWTVLPHHYDDGGYSGGSMDRPALRELLAEVAARKVDVIVVYKVDRLTRSLADFAKIVEVFDAARVSFVSVTQQFNTTTSMGRLTLNVLLSFAQFEREVTGERIRDKIAASKAKGMWMGGWVPIGYDRKDRSLTINESEAKTVRTIFELYLKFGSTRKVKAELDRLKIKTKKYVAVTGRQLGGLPFAIGHLYYLLSNPLYIGQIRHKGKCHAGQHPPIIGQDVWDQVQSQMQRNRISNEKREYAKSVSLLAGLMFDEFGRKMISTHAVKNGKRYRYYVSPEDNDRNTNNKTAKTRLPAAQIDNLVRSQLADYLTDSARLARLFHNFRSDPAIIKRGIDAAAKLALDIVANDASIPDIVRKLIRQLDAHPDRLLIALDLGALIRTLAGEGAADIHSDEIQETIEVRISRQDFGQQSGAQKLLIGLEDEAGNPAALRSLARGYCWLAELAEGSVKSVAEIARREGLTDRYVSRLIDHSLDYNAL
jgi:site-specific DNA recombinase